MDPRSVAVLDKAVEIVRAERRRVVGVRGSDIESSDSATTVNPAAVRWVLTVAAVSLAAAALVAGAVVAPTDVVGSDVTAMPGVAGVALVGLAVQGDDDAIETLRRRIERFRAGEDVAFDTDRDGELGALYESVGALAEDVRSSRARSDASECYRRRLYEITSDESLDADEKIQRLLELGRERLDVECGLITNIDADTGRYEVERVAGSDFVEAGTVTDLSRTFCRRTIASDDVLGIYDAADGYADDPGREEWGVECYIGGKIEVDDALYGTVCFVDPEPRAARFTHAERAFVDAVARWVSYAFERRERERELRLKDRALEAAPIGVTIASAVGEDNPLQYVNEAFEDLTGYDAADAIGRDCRFLQGEDTDEAAVAQLREAVDAAESTTVELRNYRADGTPFWNRVHIAPVEDDTGTVTHYVGFQEDVTERTKHERRFEALVENTPSPVYIKDESGRYLFVNEAAAAPFDVGVEEIIGKLDADLFDDDSLEDVHAGDQRVLETGEAVTREVETTIDGEEHVFLDTKYPYHDETGEVTGVMGISRDITERKDRERQLSTLIDNVPGMVYRCANERGWPFEFVSDGAEDLTGYAASELESGAVSWGEDVIVAGDRDRVWEAVQRALDDREPFEITYGIETADGERRWLWEQGQGVFDDGSLEALEGVIMDVTDQQERERELRATNERLNAIIGASPDAIIALDDEGTVEVWNPAAERIFGWSADEVVGQANPIVPDERAGEARQFLERVFDGESIAGIETKRERKDGTLVDLSLSAAPLRDEAGDVVGIMAALEDITKRKARERELEQYRAFTDDILDAIDDVFYLIDEDGSVRRWNDSLPAVTGYTDDEIAEMNAADFFATEGRERIGDAIETVLTEGSVVFDSPIVTKDGHNPHYEFDAVRVDDPDGEACIAGIGRDITERERRERELERNRDLLQQAGNIANVGGWELDFTRSPPALTWTEEMYRLHDIPPDTDLDGDTVLEYYHPDDRERIGEFLERAVTQGESYDMEVRVQTDAAKPTWVRAIGEPVFEDGDIVGVRGSVQDISERKERERHLESLRETARQFLATESPDAAAQRIVETAADLLDDAEAAVFLLDPDSNRLEPTARTDGFGDPDTLVSTITAGDSPLWQSYVSGEGATVDGASLPVASPPGDGLVVPVGEHGLLLVTLASPLAASRRRLIETLATTAETALDRIRTERNLRERDDELAAQNRRLRRQIQINDIIRRIDRSLVRASSREDIERAVCDGLVETDDVAFAWVGTLDAAEETVRPRTWAGDGETYLDTVAFSTAGHALEPAADAASRQVPTVVTNVLDNLASQPWREQALASGFHSVVSVPLAFEDYFYGVLTVYADEPGVFGDLEKSVFAELGENIAHSVNAAETQQALYADTLVELTLELDASETMLGRVAAAVDCPVTFEGLATYDDEQARLFFTAEDADADAVAAVLEDVVAIQGHRLVDEMERGPLFEVTVSGSCLPARFVRHGAQPRSIRATPTTLTAVVAVPTATDVREFVGMIDEAYPGVELVGRRTVQQSSRTQGELVTSLFEGLTDRQLEVLRTAFFAGYFEWPRRSTGEDVAEILDVSQPTVNRHLRLGQQRLLTQLFEPMDDDAAEAS